MLTLGQLMLGTILVLMGNREVRRQKQGLRRSATAHQVNPWDVWGRKSNIIWGYSMVGIALGFLLAPLGQAAWITAGFSRIALLPTPCDTAFFNKGRAARLIRNAFMLLLGCACIWHGLGFDPVLF